MKNIVLLLFVTLMFQGCVTKKYYAPEIDSIVIDMETLEPIENVTVHNLKVVGDSEKSDDVADTTKSVSSQDGCLHISSVNEHHFILLPMSGNWGVESQFSLKHPDYQTRYFLVKSFSNTAYRRYVFGLCKKYSTNCMDGKFSINYDNGNRTFKYDNQMIHFNKYDEKYASNSKELEDKFRMELNTLNIENVKIDKCIKRDEY